MYCNQCGKEISEQSKFCNYCGSPVHNARPQTPRAPQTPQTPRASAPAPAPAKKNKSNPIITILVAALVFFAVRTVTEKALTHKKPDSGTSTPVIQIQEPSTQNGSEDISVDESDVKDAMDSCIYGALYENGSLTYGMTKLSIPGYSVLPEEGGERDWLISSDNACLFTAYKQLEILDVSYDASTEAEMLNSYIQSYDNVTMVDYDKLYVDGFPVIRYIVCYSVDGAYQYQGELIVFPSEIADETIRLDLFVDVSTGVGIDAINRVFDTLQISPSFKLSFEDTQVMGLNRIVAK